MRTLSRDFLSAWKMEGKLTLDFGILSLNAKSVQSVRKLQGLNTKGKGQFNKMLKSRRT